MIKLELEDDEVLEVPESDDEFNEWNDNYSNLSRRMVTDGTRQMGTFGVKSINYYGNSSVIYELEKSPIILDKINAALNMTDGTKVMVYELPGNKVALVSLDKYATKEIHKDSLRKSINDMKTLITAVMNMESPGYVELNYLKDKWKSFRVHRELDSDEWQVAISNLTDKIWSH